MKWQNLCRSRIRHSILIFDTEKKIMIFVCVCLYVLGWLARLRGHRFQHSRKHFAHYFSFFCSILCKIQLHICAISSAHRFHRYVRICREDAERQSGTFRINSIEELHWHANCLENYCVASGSTQELISLWRDRGW